MNLYRQHTRDHEKLKSLRFQNPSDGTAIGLVNVIMYLNLPSCIYIYRTRRRIIYFKEPQL